MKKLILTDPNGHSVNAPGVVPFIVTTEAHVDTFTGYLLGAPAEQHADLMRRMGAHNTVMLSRAASSSRNAGLVYQTANYTVLVVDITPEHVADLVAHYAHLILNSVEAGSSDAYALAAYGLPLAGLLGEPDLRGTALYRAARDAVTGLAAA